MGRTKGASTSKDKQPAKRGRNSSPPPSTSSPSMPITLFWDDATRKKFLDDPYHSVSVGFSLPSDFLFIHRFNNLYNNLKIQEWTDFLEEFCEYEPMLIRQFFVNLRQRESTSDKLESIVYGKRISITADDLFKHFFRNSDPATFVGVKITNSLFETHVPNYSYATALRSLHDPLCTNPVSHFAKDLTVENRLLHHILTHTIVPRSGSYSTVTPFDVGIMFLIQNRVKINLAHLMFYHISRCSSSAHSAFPYGMHLTDFLLNFKNIPSNPKNVVSPDPKTHIYNKNSLGLLFKHDARSNSWIRKFPVSTTSNVASNVASNIASSSQEPQVSEPFSSQSVPNQLQSIYSLLSTMNESVDRRFTALETSVNTLSDHFQRFTTPTGLFNDDITVPLPDDNTELFDENDDGAYADVSSDPFHDIF